MKILVTGGCGFIGSNFIKHLFETTQEVKVTNIDKLGIGSNPNNLKSIEKNQNYTFIEGNIIDNKTLKTIISNIEIVVNFAAETHVDRSIADPQLFVENNIIGTLSLLELERRYGNKVRHIQVSTDEVYGSINTGSFNEKSNLNTSNPYSASKASADLLCIAYHKTYDMDIVISRSSNNYGPHQYQEKFIPKTIIRALGDQKIPIYGSGLQVRDWLFVRDNCTAIKLLADKGVSGEIYNISANNEVNNISLVENILKIMEKSQGLIEYVADRPGHDQRYSVDASKIMKLGWTQNTDFDKALLFTIEWYKKNYASWSLQ